MKLGDLIMVEFEDAIMDDSEYIYLTPQGKVANQIEGHLTKMSLTRVPAFFITQNKNWLLIAWHYAPFGEEGRWAVTFRIPRKWIKCVREVRVGKKIL